MGRPLDLHPSRLSPALTTASAALALVLLAAACSDDTGSGTVPDADVGADAGDAGDTSGDAAPDGAPDAEPDADALDDTGDRPDADAAADVPADALVLDLVDGCNPFAVTDECLFPYPSAFFTAADESSPTGVRLAYHDDVVALPGGAPPIHFTAFNTADGVSPITPILVHLGVDLHEDFWVGQDEGAASLVADAPIAVFDLESGERVGPIMVEMDQNLRSGHDGRHVLIVRPLAPMAFGTRHLVVMTDALTDADGQPLPSPPAFAALRDGELTVHPELEAVRADYEGYFAFLETRGYARDDVLVAWDFVTASRDYVLGPVLAMREEALDEVATEGLEYTIEAVEEAPNDHVLRIVTGTFSGPSWLTDDEVFAWDDGHLPERQGHRDVPFTLVVPASAADNAPVPLAIMGHGIFGAGRPLLTDGQGRQYFQPIADELGIAMLATDWIGLSSGDFDLLVEEVLPDLNRIDVITDRLQQSLVNTLVMTELGVGALTEDPQVWDGDGDLIDDARVYYYGVSLGGIQGSSFSSLSPRVVGAVMAVPGAGWSHMINRSTVFEPLKQVADLVYPDPLHQQVYVAMVQTYFDHSDPVNLSRLFLREPLPDAPAGRIAILQEGIGDCLVPNVATRILARSMGVAQLTPAVAPVYGLTEVSAPTTESVLFQVRLPENLADYTPSDDNTLPEEDNGVHFDAVIAAPSLAQVRGLIADGEVTHPCDGACDPD